MASSSSSDSALPSKHRALVLRSTRDPYDMSVVEKETPAAGPGSAVIRVLAASVLTYAWQVYSGRKPYPYPTPFVPGSSAIGRVATVGPDATLLQPGQLVFFDCFVSGRDDPSAVFLSGLSSGFTQSSNALMGGEWRDSTYAEYAKVPLENCLPLDEARLLGDPVADGGLGYTVDDLMFLLPMSVAIGGLRDVNVQVGEKVIVTPATGQFGSAAVLVALAMGARVVAMARNVEALETLKKAIDSNPEAHGDRLRIVQVTGDVEADTEKLTGDDGPADAFFDISPNEAATSTHFKSCIHALRRGGRASLMGAHMELALPALRIVFHDITLKGKWMYTKEDMRVLIRLVETAYLNLGHGTVKTIGRFPLERFDEAFQMAGEMRGPLAQVVIAP